MKILVVDDEPEVVDIVALALSFHRPDYEVIKAKTGMEALRLFREESPDLLILDVSMPGINGFEVTQRIRASEEVPIILLTARGLEEDKVRGLETGADDYIVKPFSHRELVARVDAVLRRATASRPAARNELFEHRDLRIDFNQRRVYLRGEPVAITPTEYSVLYHLVTNRGHVVPQELLLGKVWGQEYRDEAHYLKVYVRRLREKLEDNTAEPYYIRTVRGVGYAFPSSSEEPVVEQA